MKQPIRSIGVVAAAVLAAPALPRALLAQSSGNRVVGVDVSDWQNQNPEGQAINWSLVHTPVGQGGGGKDFAFIRSSRGGTSGTYDEHTRVGTLAQRYDDFAFEYNITNATAAGVLAGPYHFIRADIVTYTDGLGNTVTHSGTDEADHFLQQAGPYMRPGYLLPVGDIEAGNSRSATSLSSFLVAFANRIYQVKGIRPIAYINQSYASTTETNTTVSAAFPTLWMARWPNQSNPDAIPIQTDNPATGSQYGIYQQSGPGADPNPWQFWQYAGTGSNIPGLLGDASHHTDLDVAHGDIEYVKDYLVPALWKTDASGQWTTISNWNTDADPSGKGGPARLPDGGDNIVLLRDAANPVITLSSGAQQARRLTTFERLDITGGSLTVNRQAILNNAVNVSGGGAFAPAWLTVNAGASLNLAATGDRTLRVKTVAVNAGGKIDLSNNKMVVDYAAGASPIGSWNGSAYDGVTGLIASGRNGGTWGGDGIVTTMTDAATPNTRTTLAVADASDVLAISGAQTAVWKGQSVDADSVLVMYTYAGDANLDGAISGDDYFRIDSAFPQNLRGYSNGDFDYNGAIDGDDYFLIDSNFAAQGLPLGGVARVSAVPEPLAISMLAFATTLCLRRRRRR
jgi:GH25 family lysozyme M1 (1,4-beta-N-acetylmuramidase)